MSCCQANVAADNTAVSQVLSPDFKLVPNTFTTNATPSMGPYTIPQVLSPDFIAPLKGGQYANMARNHRNQMGQVNQVNMMNHPQMMNQVRSGHDNDMNNMNVMSGANSMGTMSNMGNMGTMSNMGNMANANMMDTQNMPMANMNGMNMVNTSGTLAGSGAFSSDSTGQTVGPYSPDNTLAPITPSDQPPALTLSSTQYLNGALRTQIGNMVQVQFLIGTNTYQDRTGILLGVGADYIILNEFNSDDILFCDFFTIKFVRVYK